MAALRFYLDENIPVVIAEQLRRHGIVVTTVREVGALGGEDDAHLRRAAAMGYVICTYDTDFISLAYNVASHAGIIVGQPEKHRVGEWVKALVLYHSVYSAEDMVNRVDFL